MAWIPILTAVTNSLPAQSNRMVWWSGSRTRWFDTLCFAPVGSWNYGLWLSLTYDPLIFLNGWLWYPIKKLYLSMQVFVRLWFLFLTQYLFSKCMVPTAMWLRRGLKSYRMFCAATPPRQQGKKTKLERHGFVHGFVLHTVKVRFFGPIPINKLQVKPWFDHENISVSCSSIEWICFTSIKYCSGIHFVENLLKKMHFQRSILDHFIEGFLPSIKEDREAQNVVGDALYRRESLQNITLIYWPCCERNVRFIFIEGNIGATLIFKMLFPFFFGGGLSYLLGTSFGCFLWLSTRFLCSCARPFTSLFCSFVLLCVGDRLDFFF